MLAEILRSISSSLCLHPSASSATSAVLLRPSSSSSLRPSSRNPAQALRAASPGRERNALTRSRLARRVRPLGGEAISWGKERVRLTPRGLVVRAARGQIRLRTPSGSRCLGQGHEAGVFRNMAEPPSLQPLCESPRRRLSSWANGRVPSAPIRVFSHFPWNPGPKTVPRTSKPLPCCFERRTAWSRCHRRYPASGLDRCEF